MNDRHGVREDAEQDPAYRRTLHSCLVVPALGARPAFPISRHREQPVRPIGGACENSFCLSPSFRGAWAGRLHRVERAHVRLEGGEAVRPGVLFLRFHLHLQR